MSSRTNSVRTSIDAVSAAAAWGSTVGGEGTTKVEEDGILFFPLVFLPLLFRAGAIVGVAGGFQRNQTTSLAMLEQDGHVRKKRKDHPHGHTLFLKIVVLSFKNSKII
jgi:hypothetical protein